MMSWFWRVQTDYSTPKPTKRHKLPTARYTDRDLITPDEISEADLENVANNVREKVYNSYQVGVKSSKI